MKKAEPMIPASVLVKKPSPMIAGSAAEKFILPIYDAEYAAKQAININLEYFSLCKYCWVFILSLFILVYLFAEAIAAAIAFEDI